LAYYTNRGNGCFAYRLSQAGKCCGARSTCWNFHADAQADRYGYSDAQADGYSDAQADGYSHTQADGYRHAQADGYRHAQADGYTNTVGYATQYQLS
jgi:hypothetical protein